MENIINTVEVFFNENSNLIRIIGGILLLILFAVFKNKLSSGLLNFTSLLLFSKDNEKREALQKSLKKPLAAFFALLGLFLCVYINFTFNSVIKSFKIGVILIVCWGLFNYLSDNLILSLHFNDNQNEKINTTAIKFISTIIRVIIVIFAIVMVVSELGYNINGLITGIGVGGLAISLAAQDAVSNLISGFIIVIEKPFKEGEYIETKGIQGTVEEVSMRSTKIRTLDDSLVTIPNKSLTDDKIINITRMNKRLIDIEFGLVYSTKNEVMKKCQQDIKDYLLKDESIINSPIRVEFEKLDDCSLNLNVFCYTKITDIHKYKTHINDINYQIKTIIENNGAEFAFPSSSIYIEKK